MAKKVLVIYEPNETLRSTLEQAIEGATVPVELIYRTEEEVTPSDIEEANAILGLADPALCRDYGKNLEWVQLCYAGADPFVLPGVLKEEVILCNVAGAYGTEVSEHMLMQTFELVRGMRRYHLHQSEHLWKKEQDSCSVDGSTVLVLGMGNIGGDYARKMKALGAYVIGVRRTAHDKPDYLDELYSLEDFEPALSRADIVAMILPGGENTRHFLDARRLGMLKEGTLLINAGRGPAVDAAALKEALRSGRLGGAALDVTDPEPLPADDELWDMENVVITPHCAGNLLLSQTTDKIFRILGDNLHAYTHGGEITNRVDRRLGY